MSGIQLINLGEVQAGVKRRLEEITMNQAKAAKQMAIIANQNIQDNCRVESGAWQRSWSGRVEEISELKHEVIVESNGAERYYYLQEALHHPGAIGWHQSIPEMTEIYKKNMGLK
ncbi:hypothetical protein M0R72_12265 [Candidatus Pacearchaeota archaeon]|jgi:hypothetical protein|nr:hypothetical protein [Candidatus Pacearchaeota archaeon]